MFYRMLSEEVAMAKVEIERIVVAHLTEQNKRKVSSRTRLCVTSLRAMPWEALLWRFAQDGHQPVPRAP